MPATSAAAQQKQGNGAPKGSSGVGAAGGGNAAGNGGTEYKASAHAEQTEQLKKRTYCLLYDFIQKKEQVLRHLSLPKYQVAWLRVPNVDAFREDRSDRHSPVPDREGDDASKPEGKAVAPDLAVGSSSP